MVSHLVDPGVRSAGSRAKAIGHGIASVAVNLGPLAPFVTVRVQYMQLELIMLMRLRILSVCDRGGPAHCGRGAKGVGMADMWAVYVSGGMMLQLVKEAARQMDVFMIA